MTCWPSNRREKTNENTADAHPPYCGAGESQERAEKECVSWRTGKTGPNTLHDIETKLYNVKCLVLNGTEGDNTMLELKTYGFAEIAAYLRVRRSRDVREKLTHYKVEFSESDNHADQDKTYTITAIQDPFKLFCVFDLEIAPQTDFIKLRDFTVYLLSVDDFNWRPMEMMEEYLRRFANGPSRQTISHYIKYFTDRDLIAMNGDYVYYKVNKDRGVQKHEIITKEQYAAAWAVYWNRRNNGADSRAAYSAMYSWFGGVPRKQQKIISNGFYKDDLEKLEEYATESFLSQYGEIL